MEEFTAFDVKRSYFTEMSNVHILQIGAPAQDLAVRDVVKAASKAQNHFTFSEGDLIEVIDAEPDDGAYPSEELMEQIKKQRGQENIDVVIGVIDAPLHDEMFSAVDRANECIIIRVLRFDLNKSQRC